MPYRIGEIAGTAAYNDAGLFFVPDDGRLLDRALEKECSQILGRNGLVSFIVHPDYLVEQRARKVYLDLLDYLSRPACEQELWTALPRDVNRWWRNRGQMKLVRDGDRWHIEGPDKDRARIAYAVKQGDRIAYRLHEGPSASRTI